MSRFACRTGVVCLCLLLGLLMASPLWASWSVTDALDRSVTIEDTPTRIFSGGLNLTSTVVKLKEADRLAAVGQFASDTRYSFVAPAVEEISQYQQVRPEVVLSYRPDLVLLTPFTPSKIRENILSFDVPVVVTHEVRSVKDVVKNLRLIGRALGHPVRARRVEQELRRRLTAHGSADTAGHRVLYLPESGVVPGRGTLPDQLMRMAGIVNVAAEAGLSGWKSMAPESILDRNPEWIVLDRINQSSMKRRLREDPVLLTLDALEADRVKSFWPKYLTVAGPHLPEALARWRRAFPARGTRRE